MATAVAPSVRSSTSIGVTAFIAGMVLLAVGLPGPDLVAGLIYLAADGHYTFKFRQHSGLAVLLVFVTILVLRGLVLWFYARWAKRRELFRVWFVFDKRTVLWTVASVGVAAALILRDRMAGPDPNHVSKLVAFTSYWGFAYGLTNTMLQFVYYFSEGLAMIWMADAFQTAGESKVRTWIPWGGIALALLWGGGHLFSKNLTTALALMLPGLLIGTVYSLSGRRLWPAQLLFFTLNLPELFK